MSESESLPQPATTEEAPAEPQEPQELPPAEPEVIAKPKRKPREPKKSKVIAVDVNPTEYFDDQAPPPPSPEEKPKAKPRGRAKAKPVAEPVVELVAEPVVEPVIEQVVAPVKTKRVRKPRQVKVEPEPVPDPPPIVDIEDLEDQVAKRMKALRDAREIKKKERIQALIAQAI